MKIRTNFKHFDGKMAWEHVVRHISEHDTLTTVKGIRFQAKFVGSCIFIKGGTPGTKRAEKGEYLTCKDFVYAYDRIRLWDEINTGNVKPYIKRQQTPFIALLLRSGIIE